MAINVKVEDFLEAFPTFSTAPNLVEQKLNEAEAVVSLDRFGSHWKRAVMLYTAHLLWSDAFGVSLRDNGSSESSKSPYLQEYNRLLRQRILPFAIT